MNFSYPPYKSEFLPKFDENVFRKPFRGLELEKSLNLPFWHFFKRLLHFLEKITKIGPKKAIFLKNINFQFGTKYEENPVFATEMMFPVRKNVLNHNTFNMGSLLSNILNGNWKKHVFFQFLPNPDFVQLCVKRWYCKKTYKFYKKFSFHHVHWCCSRAFLVSQKNHKYEKKKTKLVSTSLLSIQIIAFTPLSLVWSQKQCFY